MSHDTELKVLTIDEIEFVSGGNSLSPAQQAQIAQAANDILARLAPEKQAKAAHVLRP
jgi:hypothetical protein